MYITVYGRIPTNESHILNVNLDTVSGLSRQGCMASMPPVAAKHVFGG